MLATRTRRGRSWLSTMLESDQMYVSPFLRACYLSPSPALPLLGLRPLPRGAAKFPPTGNGSPEDNFGTERVQWVPRGLLQEYPLIKRRPLLSVNRVSPLRRSRKCELLELPKLDRECLYPLTLELKLKRMLSRSSLTYLAPLVLLLAYLAYRSVIPRPRPGPLINSNSFDE